MADKQDFGIKVSQSGYNAYTAPDYALAFSSSWPQLPIVAEYIATVSPINDGVPSYTYPSVTLTHNLGYPAFAMAWTKGHKFYGNNLNNIQRDPFNLTLSKTNAKWSVGTFAGNTSDTITVFIRVYALDVSKPVSYPYKQPPIIAKPYDPDYGFKIAKENKSITSRDMRDFIIHSRCQSPQVDSVNVGTSGAALTYTNGTGYTNWVFGYGTFNNGTTWRPARSDYYQSAPGLQINANAYTITAASGMIPSLIVLRDPLFVASQVEVTY